MSPKLIAFSPWNWVVGVSCLAVSVTGCSAPADGTDDGSFASGDSPGVVMNDPTLSAGVETPRCSAPEGANAAPGNIEEAVDLINALPKPTSVPCFVETLPRPLSVVASSSRTSAQPALSADSPRLFIKLDHMWISVVIDGDPSYLIEFGYLVDEAATRSIKAEVKLPLSEPLAPTAPFERVRYESGTICGMCHRDEHLEADYPIPDAFSSAAFQPRAETAVPLDTLREDWQTCDAEAEPRRCAMLDAVFGGGEVLEGPFPAQMQTFY